MNDERMKRIAFDPSDVLAYFNINCSRETKHGLLETFVPGGPGC